MEMIETSERRWMIYRIPMRYILTAFVQYGRSREVEYVVLPRIELPKGAKMLYSRHNGLGDSIDCVIEHESFAPVPPGVEIPVMNFMMEYEHVKVERPEREASPVIVEE